MAIQNIKKPVSIGMPLYNSEKYLKRSLNSLLDQDFKEYELIISDNASTDSTPEICREYSKKFKQLKINRNKKNLGVRANMRIVLEMAKGEYFMWAADDDLWSSDFISTLYEKLEMHPDAGVAMGAVRMVNEDGSLINEIEFTGKDNPDQKNFFNMVTTVAIPPQKHNLFIYGLFRTEILKKAMDGFNDDSCRDRLLLCLIALTAGFKHVDRFLFTKTCYNVSSVRPWRINDPVFDKNKLRFHTLKWVYALTKATVLSRHIPLIRKTYIVGPLYRKLMKEIKAALYPYCSENLLGLWRKLK